MNSAEMEFYFVKERGAYVYKDKNVLPMTDDSIGEKWLFCDTSGWVSVVNGSIVGFEPRPWGDLKCECGAESVGSNKHISYCPLYEH